MVDKRFVLELFNNFTESSLHYGQRIANVLHEFYEEQIKSDWQLQGSFVLLVLSLFVMVLVKIQWNKYGPSIMGMELSASKASFDSVDHAGVGSLGSVQEYPDEDPLTFVKKKTQ